VDLPKVRDVMTSPVVAVREAADYKEIIDALVRNGVSAVPVLDADDRVVGLVSEGDLMATVELAGEDLQARLFDRLRRRPGRAQIAGDTAADLMTSPAITIDADASIVEAARLMETERVKRLPVVGDEGRLAGIVARRDLLRVYLRPDAAIAEEVTREVLGRTLGIGPRDVRIEVVDGVVTLRGSVDRHSTARIAVRLTHAVTGVVDVVDALTYGYDDIADVARRHVLDTEG
jgi:CBS domain-containing protein